MNIVNLYKTIKQVLYESNLYLSEKGIDAADNLYEMPQKIDSIDNINILPYRLRNEIIEVTQDDINGITTIGDYAFYGCTNLQSVSIPNSVINIGLSSFSECTNLRDIYLFPSIAPTLKGTSAIPSIATIHVPVGCGTAYKSATNWSSHANRIVEDIILYNQGDE